MIPKLKPYRSRQWLANVHQLDQCVLCGAWGIQAAHRNEGRGMGQKSSDCLTAALCPRCHHEIDNGKDLNKDERRARMDRAIVLTIDQLARRGLLEAVK
ncbi:hypothetical protein TW86_14175 [Halomonas sp. S2151]|uniref:hypothetical protein n=1 Tax=Halomonas TaxID=2745 RepID=UPI0005F9FCC9|nr:MULTISPECIES: hypothetical protein [Halomonas]MBR9770022.1 hypothetical protein [Gammaproteobacteria bacterium]KJZ10439.1 hypothetical protein TW86_14175 [Halomonas sp. S2151]MBY6208745.1 hypothetical protein [Halomonas sp. DP3Y7-2]MBY6227215.1 hypothetical protein [Halomonas sp. DP3Y7-1]MCA0915035.1 hypothetical protein [Halomonas denitrificans]